MNIKVKIIIEQIGETSWTWEVRDAAPPRIGGGGRLGVSGNDGEYGCFATELSAFSDATKFIARFKINQRVRSEKAS
jgi:hypothetical protein